MTVGQLLAQDGVCPESEAFIIDTAGATQHDRRKYPKSRRPDER